jgi:hypothetical protein
MEGTRVGDAAVGPLPFPSRFDDPFGVPSTAFWGYICNLISSKAQRVKYNAPLVWLESSTGWE